MKGGRKKKEGGREGGMHLEHAKRAFIPHHARAAANDQVSVRILREGGREGRKEGGREGKKDGEKKARRLRG